MSENRLYDNNFHSRYFSYPITLNDSYNVVESYVCFYPVYDSYLRIAEGQPVRFAELLAKSVN